MVTEQDVQPDDASAARQLPLVAFDESGNTGQNLADPAQPVFVLASVCMSGPEAVSLIAAATLRGMPEAKFARLRGSAEGQKRLIRFLNSDLLRSSTVKVNVIHKPFLITTKIVDMLIENLIFRVGGNLYKRRVNLALANLLQTVTPVFCGEPEFSELQRRFVTMVR